MKVIHAKTGAGERLAGEIKRGGLEGHFNSKAVETFGIFRKKNSKKGQKVLRGREGREKRLFRQYGAFEPASERITPQRPSN